MIQEEKQLLLVDLCARLPYHPKGHVVNACNGAECDEWLTCATFPMFTNITNNYRLYLRPMSSMTEEEKEYLKNNFRFCFDECDNRITNGIYSNAFNRTIYQIVDEDDISNIINWLNKHHFDYRGLIKKGLALEALERMYNLDKLSL